MIEAIERTAPSIRLVDVARPELFAEDRWQEPFRELRAKIPIQYVPKSKFGPYWPDAGVDINRKVREGGWPRFNNQMDGLVALCCISTNRVGTIFGNSDRIIIDSKNTPHHPSFGYGIYRCVSTRVAELQLVTLLEKMAKRRLRVTALAGPDRIWGSFVHSFKKLMVEMTGC